MTEQEKKVIREGTNMKLFNFYLDDLTKYDVIIKLKEEGLETTKGTLSALIRTLLGIYANGEHPNLDRLVREKVLNEYELTNKKNKRSKL
jgi:hypothetical protein